jgi:hypothetical protein
MGHHIFLEMELGKSQLTNAERPKFLITIGAVTAFNNIVINFPSLHIIGEVDNNTTTSLTFSYNFYNPSVFYHQGGHKIPKVNPLLKKALSKFFRPFVVALADEKEEVRQIELNRILEAKKWPGMLVLQNSQHFGDQFPKL